MVQMPPPFKYSISCTTQEVLAEVLNHSIVGGNPSASRYRGRKRIFVRATEMLAWLCLTSPTRGGAFMGRRFLRSKSWRTFRARDTMLVALPVPMFIIVPPGKRWVREATVALITSHTNTKSRVLLPSPKITGGLPRRASFKKRVITPAYRFDCPGP